MKNQIAAAVALSIACAASARADTLPNPCPSGVKGIAMALGAENVPQIAYLCNDDTTVIPTIPGGTPTTIPGAPPITIPGGPILNGNIHLWLDAIGAGWAYECGHAIVGIKVTINGQVQELANFYRIARPDVAVAFGSTCAEMGASGLGFYPNTAGLAPGTYPMTLQVTDESGYLSLKSNTLAVTVR